MNPLPVMALVAHVILSQAAAPLVSVGGKLPLVNGNGTCTLQVAGGPDLIVDCVLLPDAGILFVPPKVSASVLEAIDNRLATTADGGNSWTQFGGAGKYKYVYMVSDNSSGNTQDQQYWMGYNADLSAPDEPSLRESQESLYASNFERYLEFIAATKLHDGGVYKLPDGGPGINYRPWQWLISGDDGTNQQIEIADVHSWSSSPNWNKGLDGGTYFSIGPAADPKYTDLLKNGHGYTCTVNNVDCLSQENAAGSAPLRLLKMDNYNDVIISAAANGRNVRFFGGADEALGFLIKQPGSGWGTTYGFAFTNGQLGQFCGVEGIGAASSGNEALSTMGCGLVFNNDEVKANGGYAPIVAPTSLSLRTGRTLPTCTYATEDSTHVAEGGMVLQLGRDAGSATKLCVCRSDGNATTPVSQWCSLALSAAAAVVCAGGTTTSCP